MLKLNCLYGYHAMDAMTSEFTCLADDDGDLHDLYESKIFSFNPAY